MVQVKTLEDFVTNIVDGKDEFMTSMSLEYKNNFLTMIQTMDLNPNTFTAALQIISDELFSKDGNNDPYITSLLLFSIELNQFCISNYSWYKKDILVHELVKILSEKCQRVKYRSRVGVRAANLFFIDSIFVVFNIQSVV